MVSTSFLRAESLVHRMDSLKCSVKGCFVGFEAEERHQLLGLERIDRRLWLLSHLQVPSSRWNMVHNKSSHRLCSDDDDVKSRMLVGIDCKRKPFIVKKHLVAAVRLQMRGEQHVCVPPSYFARQDCLHRPSLVLLENGPAQKL